MTSKTIVYESVAQSNNNRKIYQQLSNLELSNLSTNEATANTDNGKLYGSFVHTGGNYVLNLYKDSAKTTLVAHASSPSLGVKIVGQDNSSGLSGTVNFAKYRQDDTNIIVLCFLSQDSDLQMANLDAVDDYDPTLGFANFHIQAFAYLQEFVIGRHRELLFDTDRVDTNNLNSSTGGYDLSRVVNWSNFREVSAQWALSRILERQVVEPDSIFDKRSQNSKHLVNAYLEKINVRFDTDFDRVDNRTRSFGTWKLSRG